MSREHQRRGEVCAAGFRHRLARVRDLDVIDGELRLVTSAWRVARELTRHSPSTELIDALLDERAAMTVAQLEPDFNTNRPISAQR